MSDLVTSKEYLLKEDSVEVVEKMDGGRLVGCKETKLIVESEAR